MAVALADISSISSFDCTGDATSIGPRWKRWKRAFNLYLQSRGVTDDLQKRALLLHTAGMDVQDIFETLVDPVVPEDGEEDEAGKCEKALRTLDAHFLPQVNVPFERHIFRQMTRKENETVDQFVSRLTQQAANCNFQDLERENVRDQVIDCCRSKTLRRKLLEKGTGLTLATVQQIARAMEAVDLQAKAMEHEPGEVHFVKETKHGKNSGKTGKQKKKGNCYRCGKPGHFASNTNCPARNTACDRCGHKGHFTTQCKTKQPAVNKNTQDKETRGQSINAVGSDDEYVFSVNQGQGSSHIDVNIGGVGLNMLIDSGASCNIIDKSTWENLKCKKIKCKSEKTTQKLYGYNCDKPFTTLGKFNTEISIGDNTVYAEFVVIDGKGYPLLGRKTAEQLNVLRLGPQVYAVKSEIAGKYPECFKGFGKLKGFQAKIHVNPEISPVAQRARRIPYSLRPKVENKLKELIGKNIIEEVQGPTPWVSPVVIVPKPNDDIRLCVDMRQANQAIVRERFPIPTVDEVLHSLNQSAVFTKLDLKWGFHQIELDEESRSITTFATHTGLYRYKRLMFGISSAPEMYQHILQQVFADCEGVRNLSDDIIIHGKNHEDHDKRLEKALERVKEMNLTLNEDKCAFGMDKLEFMGHVLSGRGIGTTVEKVKAITNAREPETVAEVRSFLGLVNYSARFIRDLATRAEPLRKLTRKSEPFIWGNEQKAAFQDLKSAISDSEILGYFDKDAVTQIITDASPVGLGPVLVQWQNGEKRIISYASRSLTDVERRYSQTEKEALGIVWACEKFHMYLYGTKFELVTDHKPLQYIYSRKSQPSARIERWVLRLQQYDFSVKYIPGPQNIADPLSRLTQMTDCTVTGNDAESYINFVAQQAVPKALSLSQVEAESDKDPELCEVRNCILSDERDKCPPAFKTVRYELSMLGTLVLRGTRLVIPASLRQQVMDLAHEGHQGIIKTKQRLRTKVWWPGIDKQAENKCRRCHACQLVTAASYSEPVFSTALPTAPWQHLTADLLGPLPDGKNILVVVDCFSRYFEVDILGTTTTDRVITAMERVFCTHGYPLSLKTDNGSQFTSREFTDYLEENGIEHRRTTPLWPQANGEVERQNRSLLKALKIASVQQLDRQKELNRFLLAYRSTPHCTTGVSPAELLYGRKIRTKLPELQTDPGNNTYFKDHDSERKQRNKDYADTRRHARHFDIQVGDEVLLQQRKENKLSTRYEEDPYNVVDKCGSQVTIQSPHSGARYKRNTTHLKKLHRDGDNDINMRDIAPDADNQPEKSVAENLSNSDRHCDNPVLRRSVRESRAPKYLEDFVQ